MPARRQPRIPFADNGHGRLEQHPDSTRHHGWACAEAALFVCQSVTPVVIDATICFKNVRPVAIEVALCFHSIRCQVASETILFVHNAKTVATQAILICSKVLSLWSPRKLFLSRALGMCPLKPRIFAVCAENKTYSH